MTSAAATPPEVRRNDEATNQRLPHTLLNGAKTDANLHMLIGEYTIDFWSYSGANI